jgi:perosamine synthetase
MINNNILRRLAVHNGPKVRKLPMPSREAFGSLEVKKLEQAIKYYRSRKIDPPYSGVFENELCKKFSNYMGGGYSDAVTSGTAGIYTSLQALRLKKGSEVLITAVTDSGPLNCIIQLGLKAKIVDTAIHSYNSCFGNFIKAITNKTKCVIATHAAGEPVHGVDKLYKYLKKRKIFLIEDCSQSPSAKYLGKKVGLFSDIAVFSTMYRKTLHTGGNGGIVFTRNKNLYKMLLAAADKGKQAWRTDIDLRNPNFSIMPALNFTTNDLSCAIGLASLERLDKTIKLRNNWIEKFIPYLKKTKTCYPYNFNKGFSIFFFPIFVRTNLINCSKQDFANALIAEGIGLQPHYGCVISDWKWAKPFINDFKIAKNASKTRDNSFNLFVNEKYGMKEIKDITNAIIKVEHFFLKKNNKIQSKKELKLDCCGFKNGYCDYRK